MSSWSEEDERHTWGGLEGRCSWTAAMHLLSLVVWLLQILVVVEEEVIGAGAGVDMGGVVNLTGGDEGEEGGCKVAGKMGTLTTLSPARGAAKVAGAEAVEDRYHS